MLVEALRSAARGAGRLAYSETDSAARGSGDAERRHRRSLRHRRSRALGCDRAAAGGSAAPPRGGRGRPRRDAAAANALLLRAALGRSAARARIWFCAGIGSSSMRGMRGGRTAGRSACGGMNGPRARPAAVRLRRLARPARRTASASAAIGRMVTSSIAVIGAAEPRPAAARSRPQARRERLRHRAVRLLGALGALRPCAACWRAASASARRGATLPRPPAGRRALGAPAGVICWRGACRSRRCRCRSPRPTRA